MIHLADIPAGLVIVLAIVAVWELVWKGMALWRSARRGDQAWFVIILIVNTVGILPIVYLLTTKPAKK